MSKNMSENESKNKDKNITYEEFLDTIVAMVAADDKLALPEELLELHRKGETSEEEKEKLWIQDTNIKYFKSDSDVLMGDFLMITAPKDPLVFCRIELKSMFDDYRRRGWEDVEETILHCLKLCDMREGVLDHVDDFNTIRDRLIIRPISYTQERMSLKNAVYKVYGDIALVLYIFLSEKEHGYNTCKLPKDVLKVWEKESAEDIDELWQIAMQNTMLDALPRMYMRPEDTENPPFAKGAFMSLSSPEKFHIGKYDIPLITTTRQLNGAIAMFYPGVMERLGELIGDDYYVAFTSICEARIHPKGSKPPREILWRLKQSNKVFPDTVLSSRVFHYDVKEKKFEALCL